MGLLPGLKPDPFAVDLKSQETALALVRTMAASGKPMLCICLGMQVLTIALGGDLYQDIPTQLPSEIAHAKPINTLEERWRILHCVQTAEGSLIRHLTGAGEISVNSIHHQAVKTLAPGFSATAWAPDGIIESVESDTGKILGVQWHPENLAHAGMEHGKALFRWLVQTAAQ
ncbi:MAG: gamma-glutamyl-gamma-aminobutyrate hydrolase family protein [Faecousia sp.]